MSSIISSSFQSIQNTCSFGIAKVCDAKSYVLSHKLSSVVTLVAVGALAYLASENQMLAAENQILQAQNNKFQSTLLDLPKVNQWTVGGPSLNAVTMASINPTVCTDIIAAANGEISDPVTNLLYEHNGEEISFSYEFSDSSLSPLELLIHNNCLQEAKALKNEILSPDFDAEKLKGLIVAAAAAKNIPLWNELMTTLVHLDDSKVQFKQAIAKSLKAVGYDISGASASFYNYRTPYDVANSLQDLDERNAFVSMIRNSRFLDRLADDIFPEINKQLEENVLSRLQPLKLSMHLANAKSKLNEFWDQQMIKSKAASYPNIQRCMNKDWEDC